MIVFNDNNKFLNQFLFYIFKFSNLKYKSIYLNKHYINISVKKIWNLLFNIKII